MTKVVEARNFAMGVSKGDLKSQAEAENALTGTLKTLFAISENYPDLYPYDDKKLADIVAALEIAKEALETHTKKEMPDYIHTTIEEDEENDEVISIAESL